MLLMTSFSYRHFGTILACFIFADWYNQQKLVFFIFDELCYIE